MGMQFCYRRLSAGEWAALEAVPERAMTFLFSMPGFDIAGISGLLGDPSALAAKGPEILAAVEKAQADPTRVDLEKDWHALHFLLTGDASLDPQHHPNEPLHNVVMGGTPTSVEASYGPVRKLEGEDLQQIADALRSVSVNDLRQSFSAEKFNAADIYPNPRPGGWDADELEGLFQTFPKLQQLFADACKMNEIVILYMA
jgi:hypothetical protein